MMVRPLSAFLQVAVAATVVNAQLGDFFKNAFGGAIGQIPLGKVDTGAIVAANTHDITSENWRSSVNVTLDAAASEDDAQEWLLYFTTQATNGTTLRNVTYWDGIYNDTVYAISSAKPTSRLHFGKVNCSASAAAELCHSFFLTRDLPVFYHIATYFNNGSTEIRRVPFDRNATESDQKPAFLAKFHFEKEWKAIAPWTGIFNPIDGALKNYTPILGKALQYYEMMPQWAFMIGISLLGRTITSRIAGGRNTQRPASAPAATS